MHTQSSTVVNSTGTTEGVAVTTPAVTVNLPAGSGIAITGSLNILTGASGTLVTIKCRQGTAITGAQVGSTKTVTTVAATNNEIPFNFYDSAPVTTAGGSQYSVTVTENAGTWTAQFAQAFTDVVSGVG